jgi:ribosome recycling factor
MLSELKKDGGASEDDVERAKKKAEEIVAEGVQGVETIVHGKEKDILEI